MLECCTHKVTNVLSVARASCWQGISPLQAACGLGLINDLTLELNAGRGIGVLVLRERRYGNYSPLALISRPTAYVETHRVATAAKPS
jgi:hypothetical protein